MAVTGIIGGGASTLLASRVAIVAHVLALTLAIMMLVWVLHFQGGVNIQSDDAQQIFNVHPLVMCLGFILVIGEAILAHTTVPLERMIQKLIHMMLHLLALILGIVGVYAAFKFHNASDIDNLLSLHSWIGITTISLFGLQWLLGFAIFWFPGAPTPIRKAVAPLHMFSGLTIFLMSVGTALTGLVQVRGIVDGQLKMVNFMGILFLLFGMTVAISVGVRRAML